MASTASCCALGARAPRCTRALEVGGLLREHHGDHERFLGFATTFPRVACFSVKYPQRIQKGSMSGSPALRSASSAASISKAEGASASSTACARCRL